MINNPIWSVKNTAWNCIVSNDSVPPTTFSIVGVVPVTEENKELTGSDLLNWYFNNGLNKQEIENNLIKLLETV